MVLLTMNVFYWILIALCKNNPTKICKYVWVNPVLFYSFKQIFIDYLPCAGLVVGIVNIGNNSEYNGQKSWSSWNLNSRRLALWEFMASWSRLIAKLGSSSNCPKPFSVSRS